MIVINELRTLETLIERHRGALGSRLRTSVPVVVGPGEGYAVHVIELGSQAPEAPAVGFFGGIHGNERIGSDVVLAFLHSVLEAMQWDESLQHLLDTTRLVFMPLINPTGMARNRRATGAGIDLMRNAPVESAHAHWLLGGQRITRYLPWYRGRRDELAPENRAVLSTVREKLMNAPLSIALDCHSGFGIRNYIWFPYAHSRVPIPHLAEIYALRKLFRRTYPNHVTYRIEPQCRHYMTHGDIWDALYMESLATPERVFLPLTLEMGSWLWVKKNPRQLFTRLGLFNPLVPHRKRRILRQHLLWFDFLTRAVHAHRRWVPDSSTRPFLAGEAWAYWGHHYQGDRDPLRVHG
ncbi:MAG: DUF2817 domain-containing protein [Oceanococcus sp.]|nr:MAG: DUF2817 domain-containing protein [Oceanococcus sp.]